jgi:hypothetical protein
MWHKNNSNLKERENWIYLFDSFFFIIFYMREIESWKREKKIRSNNFGIFMGYLWKKIKNLYQSVNDQNFVLIYDFFISGDREEKIKINFFFKWWINIGQYLCSIYVFIKI